MLLLWFNIIIVALCVLDFWIISRSKESVRTSIYLSCFWIFCGITFSGVVYATYGSIKCYEYLSGYFIEKTLSVDNLFVFYYIFSSLGIKTSEQSRLLFIGIFSAIIFRIIMIYITFTILDTIAWLIYPLGAFLMYCGIHAFFDNGDKSDDKIVESVNKMLAKFKCIKFAKPGDGFSFFKYDNGTLFITTGVLAILAIEFSDILFAVDSIPAVFAVTKDKSIAYMSNILAILGLRSLYHVFAITIDRFYYFKHAISLIMIIVGIKMMVSNFIHVDPVHSLILLLFIFIVAFIASNIRAKRLKS